MNKCDIGQEILEGLQEIKAYKAGKVTQKTRELKNPDAPKEIRAQGKTGNRVASD